LRLDSGSDSLGECNEPPVASGAFDRGSEGDDEETCHRRATLDSYGHETVSDELALMMAWANALHRRWVRLLRTSTRNVDADLEAQHPPSKVRELIEYYNNLSRVNKEKERTAAQKVSIMVSRGQEFMWRESLAF
jgi:hypothetical protein